MSGGGLWRIANAVTTERPHAKLVGVLIEYHERVRIILATRVAWALSALADLDVDSGLVLKARYPGI